MRRYLAYALYVIRHKWFVSFACLRLGVSLWTALVHDWTKFLPCEFFPYAHNFFNVDGSRRTVRDKTGAYDPNAQGDRFARAWLHHQHNHHHWQAHISIGDGGNLQALLIPEKYIREMVADWIGAGLAIKGKDEHREWYEANKDKMVLHPETRKRIEELVKWT